MKRFRSFSCVVFALSLLFYALPRLPAEGILHISTGFSLIWTLFALLVVVSNLIYASNVIDRKKRGRPQSFPGKHRQIGQEQSVSKKRRFSVDL